MKKLNEYIKYLKSEEGVFRIVVGLKFMLTSFFCLMSIVLFSLLLTKINVNFFISQGFPGASEFQDALFDYILMSINYEFAWAIFGLLIMFIAGFYLSGIMLRPFKGLSSYCDSVVEENSNCYGPDFLSDLKLLTSFTVYFFDKIERAVAEKKLEKIEVPDQFTKVHKPIFEFTFFLNYFFVVIIISLISAIGIVILSFEIQNIILELAHRFLSGDPKVKYFFIEQFKISNIAMGFFLVLHFILYIMLGFNLYSKISTPAFAIFATFRSFLKGNLHNRIHLLGFYYLRNDCRKINRYLDFVQKKLT